MADIGEEVEAGLELVQQYAQELFPLHPSHELLVYLWQTDGTAYDDEAGSSKWDEMTDRFWDKPSDWRKQPGALVNAYVLGRYAAALRDAVAAAKNNQPDLPLEGAS